MSEALLGDVKMAVTEACTNVILHAYDNGTPGTIEVEIDRSTDELTVIVRDTGSGFRPRTFDTERSTQRLGLPLIAALSDRFEIGHANGSGGTQVTMAFDLPGS